MLDDDGNLLTCSFDVTVIDGVAPTITCPGDQLLTAASGETTVDLPDYTGDATASDNCTDPVTVTQDPAPGTVVDIGATETVTLTATDEAGNTTTCAFDVVVDALGVEDAELSTNITIFPNPTDGDITLSNRGNVSLTEVVITDVNARVLQTIDMAGSGTDTVISLGQYASGVYFVRVSTENASTVKRIVKKVV